MKPIYFINILLLLAAVALTTLWATSKPSAMETPNPPNQLTSPLISISGTEKPPEVKPLDFYQEVVMKRNIFAKVIPKPVVTITSPQTRFKVTGIIFDAFSSKLSSAFIFDSDKRVENVYYEGDPLAEWTIKKIDKKKVVLINETNEETILTPTPDAVSQASAPKTPPVKAPENPQRDEFSSYKTGNQRLTPEKVEAITNGMKEIIKNMSKEVVLQKIEEYAEISPTEISPNVKLEDYATRLLLLNEGADIPGEGERITFGTTVKQDNTPINPATTFNATRDKRIYASFPNAGLLQGLSKVSTRWMNATTGEIAYLGTQPINATAPNNFIYVEKAKGWDKGVYHVELFKIDTMEKVGQGRFEIKE